MVLFLFSRPMFVIWADVDQLIDSNTNSLVVFLVPQAWRTTDTHEGWVMRWNCAVRMRARVHLEQSRSLTTPDEAESRQCVWVAAEGRREVQKHLQTERRLQHNWVGVLIIWAAGVPLSNKLDESSGLEGQKGHSHASWSVFEMKTVCLPLLSDKQMFYMFGLNQTVDPVDELWELDPHSLPS